MGNNQTSDDKPAAGDDKPAAAGDDKSVAAGEDKSVVAGDDKSVAAGDDKPAAADKQQATEKSEGSSAMSVFRSVGLVLGKVMIAMAQPTIYFDAPTGRWRPSEDPLLAELLAADDQLLAERSPLLQRGMESARAQLQLVLPDAQGDGYAAKLWHLVCSTPGAAGSIVMSELNSYSSSTSLAAAASAAPFEAAASDPLLAECARLSKWAYLQPESRLRQRLAEQRYQLLAVRATPSDGVTLVVAQRDAALYLVFRGSATVHDWVHNLAAGVHCSTNGCNFHAGMLQRALQHYLFVRPLLAAAQRAVTDVVVTGHSLGAGTAFLTAALLRQLDDQLVADQRLHLRLFAPPAVSNCGFDETLRRGDSLVSVVYRDDIVPALSLGSLLRCSGVDAATVPARFFLAPPGDHARHVLHISQSDQQHTFAPRPAVHLQYSLSIRQLLADSPVRDHKMSTYLAVCDPSSQQSELEHEQSEQSEHELEQSELEQSNQSEQPEDEQSNQPEHEQSEQSDQPEQSNARLGND